MLRYLSTGIVICGFVCSASWAQESRAKAPGGAKVAKGSAKVDERPARQLIRWKFPKGDVLRYESKMIEKIVIDSRDEFRNERTYVFRWTVRDVDAEGTADIAVAFERVLLDLQAPRLQFDSADDKPSREPTDLETRRYYYEARALACSEFTCSATARGGTGAIVGGEAVGLTFAPIQFTPGDWPALPEKAVAERDLWKTPASVADSMGSKSGESTNELRGRKMIEQRSVLEIESTTEFTKVTGPVYQRAQLSPTSVVAYFDPAAGRYLLRQVKTSATGRTGDDRPFLLNVEATFRSLSDAAPSDWQARKPVEALGVGKDQEIMIICHSDWLDENKNGIPDELTELKGIKTQLSEDEKLCLTLIVSGLKGRKLRYDLVNAQGKTLASSDIPLNHDNVFAIRQTVDDTGTRSGLDAGMYFVQWYLDDRYFHFTPVHIVGGQRARAAALAQRLPTPKTAEEFIARGHARFEQEDFDGAIQDFGAAIRLDPRHWQAHLLRGVVYIRKLDGTAAEADLTASIRLNAANPAAFAMRALCRLRSGQLDGAIEDATESIRLDPALDHTHTYSTRAEAWAGKGDLQKAIADYGESVKRSPDDAAAYRQRGRLWALQKEFDKCIADETEALRLEPTDPVAHIYRGNAWVEKGEWDKGIADLDLAIRMSPASPKPYISRAEVWRKKGEFDKAIADYDAAIRLDPTNAVIFHIRGDLLAERGNFDQSIADHSEVLRMNPKDTDAWAQRGAAYLAKGELEKGIADLTEALRLKPDHYVALCIRGDAWISKQEYQRSINDHTAAISANPKLASAYHHRGAALSTVGKYGEAIKDFEEAIRLDPQVPWPHFAYSLILSASPDAKFRDGKRAVAMAKTAGDLLEWKRPEVWMTLAAAHAETGDFDAAVQAQTKALELKPGDQDLQTQLDLYRQRKPFRDTPRSDKPAPRRARF